MESTKFNLNDNDLVNLANIAKNLKAWKETAYTELENAENEYNAILADYETFRTDDWDAVQKASEAHTIASQKYDLIDDLVYRLENCGDDLWFIING